MIKFDDEVIEVYSRSPDSNWQVATVSGSETLQLDMMPNGSFTVALGEIYDGTDLPFIVKEDVELYDFV